MRCSVILSVAKNAELGYTKLILYWGGMRMNVLLINGSPKGSRSNTYRLASAFVDGMRQAEDITLKDVSVSLLQIKPCLGCFACWNKTPGKCCLSDDMSQLLQDMLWADVTVWSFPLYYFSVPGPLKNLMDRQLPLSMPFMTSDSESGGHPSRYDMSGKRNVVISTCGFYTAKGNYDGVDAVFDHLCGKGNYTAIYCGQGELFRVKELRSRTDEYLSYVREAGKEFCSDGISRETREKLSQLLYPREVFEAMADASWGVEKTGEKSDETLTFTRQMAALYNPKAYPGKDMVLEMDYTDVNRRYQIRLSKDGSKVLTEDFCTPTTTIETPYAVWKAIASGEMSGQDALMQQKYRVKGDFSLMLQWDKFFGSESGKPDTQNSHIPSTNMNIMLIPWITFWVASAIDGYYGALISMFVCTLVPLMYHKNRKTFYDYLSGMLVTVCAIALMMTSAQRIMLPLSYFAFGLMWTVSGFFKLPLTAHYSMNEYGREEALKNPLFIKTNRILTFCWGVLYLITPVWTYFLMGSPVSSFTGAINSVLPMLMGIFTGWFQRWYPAKVARGD